MQDTRHGQRKRRDRRVEVPPVLREHLVGSPHRSDGRLEMSAAGVLEALAGLEQRLLPDHPQTLDLDYLAVRIGDDPMTADELCGNIARVADRDRVDARGLGITMAQVQQVSGQLVSGVGTVTRLVGGLFGGIGTAVLILTIGLYVALEPRLYERIEILHQRADGRVDRLVTIGIFLVERQQMPGKLADELPILLGTIPFGLIYGVVARSAGIPALVVQAMSLIVLAGSAQFVAAQLIGAAVAMAAFREGIRQPMFWLLTLTFLGLILISPFIPYFTFGEDFIMVKELGFDTAVLAATAFGVLAAAMSISEEIEGRTAVTLMSKPVSRRQLRIA